MKRKLLDTHKPLKILLKYKISITRLSENLYDSCLIQLQDQADCYYSSPPQEKKKKGKVKYKHSQITSSTALSSRSAMVENKNKKRNVLSLSKRKKAQHT